MGLFGNVRKNLEQMCPKLLQSLLESIFQIETKQLINSKFSDFSRTENLNIFCSS